MNNIVGNHITNVQENFRKYNTLVLKNKYDKKISDELIQTYIDARYYNYGLDNNIKFFYRRIYGALMKKGNELIKKSPRRKELIDNMVALFQYYFYFDNVRNNVGIDEIVASIAEKRIFKLNLKTAIKENFEENFSEIVKEDIKKLDESLKIYDSEDFKIETKKMNNKKNNYYKVKLKYNFEFPTIFCKEAIEEVFSTTYLAEDRLFVEYPMVTIKILKDILDGDFSKIYICDFAIDLLNKKKKLEQLLQIINNQATQERMCFEIKYDDFKENKDEIFELLKSGFNFALKTNDKMPKLSNEEIKILEIFSCVIVSPNDINKKKYKNTKILEKQ